MGRRKNWRVTGVLEGRPRVAGDGWMAVGGREGEGSSRSPAAFGARGSPAGEEVGRDFRVWKNHPFRGG